MLLNIEYNSSKCVGAKKCIQAASNYFIWNGKKAELKGAVTSKGMQQLTIEVNTDEVEQFIRAASSCPVNAIKLISNEKLIVGTELITDNIKEIVAHYDDEKEFVLDPKGYFLIRINAATKEIEVGFCNERNKVVLKVTGKKPIDIYHTIINKENLDIRKDHCAYLGRELQKAYIALQLNINYVQDDELKFK